LQRHLADVVLSNQVLDLEMAILGEMPKSID
jgi:hypothetical protein